MVGSLREATIVLGIVPAAAGQFRIAESEWYDAGPDVQALDFDVFCDGSPAGIYVVKASTSAADRPAHVVDEWNMRRDAVSLAGVEVPRLIGVGRGLLIEERIPYSFPEALSVAGRRSELIRAFGTAVRRLVHFGFRPLSCASWRSRGTDVVVADFANELGAPAIRHDSPESYIETLLVSHLDLIASDEERGLLFASAEI
ncbi:hypothetical protein [Paractinoplanes deccanensis]|nr:hypothetical protein [Actinoplanes deccanensis]